MIPAQLTARIPRSFTPLAFADVNITVNTRNRYVWGIAHHVWPPSFNRQAKINVQKVLLKEVTTQTADRVRPIVLVIIEDADSERDSQISVGDIIAVINPVVRERLSDYRNTPEAANIRKYEIHHIKDEAEDSQASLVIIKQPPSTWNASHREVVPNNIDPATEQCHDRLTSTPPRTPGRVTPERSPTRRPPEQNLNHGSPERSPGQRTPERSPENRLLERKSSRRVYETNLNLSTPKRSFDQRTPDRSPSRRIPDRSLNQRVLERSAGQRVPGRGLSRRSYDRITSERASELNLQQESSDGNPTRRAAERSPSKKSPDRNPSHRAPGGSSSQRGPDSSPNHWSTDRSPSPRSPNRNTTERAPLRSFSRTHDMPCEYKIISSLMDMQQQTDSEQDSDIMGNAEVEGETSTSRRMRGRQHATHEQRLQADTQASRITTHQESRTTRPSQDQRSNASNAHRSRRYHYNTLEEIRQFAVDERAGNAKFNTYGFVEDLTIQLSSNGKTYAELKVRDHTMCDVIVVILPKEEIQLPDIVVEVTIVRLHRAQASVFRGKLKCVVFDPRDVLVFPLASDPIEPVSAAASFSFTNEDKEAVLALRDWLVENLDLMKYSLHSLWPGGYGSILCQVISVHVKDDNTAVLTVWDGTKANYKALKMSYVTDPMQQDELELYEKVGDYAYHIVVYNSHVQVARDLEPFSIVKICNVQAQQAKTSLSSEQEYLISLHSGYGFGRKILKLHPQNPIHIALKRKLDSLLEDASAANMKSPGLERPSTNAHDTEETRPRTSSFSQNSETRLVLPQLKRRPLSQPSPVPRKRPAIIQTSSNDCAQSVGKVAIPSTSFSKDFTHRITAPEAGGASSASPVSADSVLKTILIMESSDDGNIQSKTDVDMNRTTSAQSQSNSFSFTSFTESEHRDMPLQNQCESETLDVEDMSIDESLMELTQNSDSVKSPLEISEQRATHGKSSEESVLTNIDQWPDPAMNIAISMDANQICGLAEDDTSEESVAPYSELKAFIVEDSNKDQDSDVLLKELTVSAGSRLVRFSESPHKCIPLSSLIVEAVHLDCLNQESSEKLDTSSTPSRSSEIAGASEENARHSDNLKTFATALTAEESSLPASQEFSKQIGHFRPNACVELSRTQQTNTIPDDNLKHLVLSLTPETSEVSKQIEIPSCSYSSPLPLLSIPRSGDSLQSSVMEYNLSPRISENSDASVCSDAYMTPDEEPAVIHIQPDIKSSEEKERSTELYETPEEYIASFEGSQLESRNQASDQPIGSNTLEEQYETALETIPQQCVSLFSGAKDASNPVAEERILGENYDDTVILEKRHLGNHNGHGSVPRWSSSTHSQNVFSELKIDGVKESYKPEQDGISPRSRLSSADAMNVESGNIRKILSTPPPAKHTLKAFVLNISPFSCSRENSVRFLCPKCQKMGEFKGSSTSTLCEQCLQDGIMSQMELSFFFELTLTDGSGALKAVLCGSAAVKFLGDKRPKELLSDEKCVHEIEDIFKQLCPVHYDVDDWHQIPMVQLFQCKAIECIIISTLENGRTVYKIVNTLFKPISSS